MFRFTFWRKRNYICIDVREKVMKIIIIEFKNYYMRGLMELIKFLLYMLII